MKALFALMFSIGSCLADETSLAVLSKLLDPGEIVRVDCSISRITDVKDVSRIANHLKEEGRSVSIDDENLLKEINAIFEQRYFVRKKLLVSPRLRNYLLFIFVFSDEAKLALINSSSFGTDQFVVVSLSGDADAIDIQEIEISVRDGQNKQVAALSLPGFRKSAFLRRVVESIDQK